ncbi:MAG: DNA/RNA non-specific endonuclease [Myxococcota bacterium]
MRQLTLLLPLLLACGPNVASIANDDEPLPRVASQRVDTAIPVMPMGTLPMTGGFARQPPAPDYSLELAPWVLAEVQPAPEPTIDAGVEPPLDAGAEPTVDPGPIDAGLEPGFDAGSTTGFVDAGTEADAGVEPFIDAGVMTPDDGGVRGISISPHLALGIPDLSGIGQARRWLLVRSQFVSSYDTLNKVPNWTAWTLAASDFGAATRATTFRTDPLLPSGTPQAVDGDYRLSGFDRGHLCPSADRTATDADNDATFFLTNVVPQTHASNAGPWLDLEDESRTHATAGRKLVIIAGPIFGVTPQTIGSGVAVPLSMFKVAVVMDTTATINANTRIYAAVVPNSTVVSGSWRQFQVTARSIEQQTGLDFLSDLPRATQDLLENRIDP